MVSLNPTQHAAAVLLARIDALGDSFETRMALLRIEEAMLWIDRHSAAAEISRTTPNDRRFLLDLYDRIIAAVASIQSGDSAAVQAHVAAIDTHLQSLDTEETDHATRLANIEAGLNKIADAVNPVTPATGATGATGAAAGATGGATGATGA